MKSPERFKNALIIQEGASNRRLVSRKLHEAIVECQDEGKDPDTDPACKLILHHLTWIMVGRDIYRNQDQWSNDYSACEFEVLRASVGQPEIRIEVLAP